MTEKQNNEHQIKSNINKIKLRESNELKDLVRMRPEVALLESMFRSKTLSITVLIALCFAFGFGYFLVKQAGNL